jgi:streptomycin 6-kinase
LIDVPDIVRTKAMQAGEERWLRDLPSLVADLERKWSIVLGSTLAGGSEAFVAEATMADGTPAVLKLLIPHTSGAARHEITVLRLINGEGCARLFRSDISCGAMLLERLGRTLFEAGLPFNQQLEVMTATVMRVWRPAAGEGFTTGAEKGRWLIDFIKETWEETGRACSERAVAYAIECAERRVAAHDDERAVLVHGDVHQWNTLEAGVGYKLIDPDGLLAEPEYDLGVLMRGDSLELIQGDPMERAHWLARRTDRDATAIWEWGAVERVSSGLLCTKLGLQPEGREMLDAAEVVAT